MFHEKHKTKLSPLKMPRLSKEAQKKDDVTKIFKNIINIGMIRNSKTTAISLSGFFPEVVM